MQGKVAIVTGGERGIGRGIVQELLSRGMKVCIAGIDTASAAETLSLMDKRDDLMFLETDVSQEAAVRETVAEVVASFGRLDAVVANAGIADPERTPVESLELSAWERVLATNLTGVFLCAKHSFPELRKRRGSMVLIASTRALQSEPHTIAYSASKGGVVALAHSLAISGGPEIRVNAVSPGWIHDEEPTDFEQRHHAQHPVGRVGRPGDIATMTAFLLSDEAGFVTGQNFVVDGGMTRKMIYAD